MDKIINAIKKSKTIQFALLLAILGVVEANFNIFQQYLPPESYGIALTIVSIIVAILRVITTLPLDEK